MSTTRSLRRTIVELAFVTAGALPVVGLASPAAAAPPEDEAIDITPDEGPELSVKGYDTEEGDPGDQISLPFIVTASHAPHTDITFRLDTGAVGFGAVPGEDFEPVDDHFVLPRGETAVILLVPIIPDDAPNDHDGLVIAWIGEPSSGSIGTSTAVAEILDDDPPADDGSGGDEPVDAGMPHDQPDGSGGDETRDEGTGPAAHGGDPTDDGLQGAREGGPAELAVAVDDRSPAGDPVPDLAAPVLGGVLAAVIAAIGFVVARLRRGVPDA